MYFDNNWAVIIPMANEEQGFHLLSDSLTAVLNRLGSGEIYFIIDEVSKDHTLEMAQALAAEDGRFHAVWAPENTNVVDAYLRGYREAYEAGHEIIIEMDAGLSHDPRALPMFLRVLNEGNECAFGSRYINGGSMADSPPKRRFISKFGSGLANVLLGTSIRDMTSGYQGFHRHIVKQLLDYGLKSKAHFYQTEVRYLLRETRYMEVPIHYRAPSPSVSDKAVTNSLYVLLHYFFRRLSGRSVRLEK